MDKIEKALARLSSKEQRWVKEILIDLNSNNDAQLHIQKLKGHTDIYRVRKGDIRIIYRKTLGEIFVLAIERRSEKTYRDY